MTPVDLQTVRAVLLASGIHPREHFQHIAQDFGTGIPAVDQARAISNYRAVYGTLPGAFRRRND